MIGTEKKCLCNVHRSAGGPFKKLAKENKSWSIFKISKKSDTCVTFTFNLELGTWFKVIAHPFPTSTIKVKFRWSDGA